MWRCVEGWVDAVERGKLGYFGWGRREGGGGRGLGERVGFFFLGGRGARGCKGRVRRGLVKRNVKFRE